MGSPRGRLYGRLGVGVLMGSLLLVVDIASTAARSATSPPISYTWPTVDAAPLLKWSAVAAALLVPGWLAFTRRWPLRARVAVVGWILLMPAVLLAVSLLGTSNVTQGTPARPIATGAASATFRPAATVSPQTPTGGGSGVSTLSTAGRYSLLVAFGLALAAAVAGVILLRGSRGLEDDAADDSPLGGARMPAAPTPTSAPRNPREAIIRDYRAMELALSTHGHPRSPWQTSTEYAASAAAGVSAAQRDTERLTHLFELARYSAHDIDDEARRQADAHLAGILDDLARPREAGDAGAGP